MAKQNDNGSAFEAAVADAFLSELNGFSNDLAEIDSVYPVVIGAPIKKKTPIKTPYQQAKLVLQQIQILNSDAAKKFNDAATAAVTWIIKIEPRLTSEAKRIKIKIMPDDAGKYGDVRDIVLTLYKDNDASKVICELGFSCKNNHSALKHQRASAEIDIAQQWFGSELSVSNNYFLQIKSWLEKLNSIKASGKILWSDLDTNLKMSLYKEIITIIANELEVLLKNPGAPQNFIQYLVGHYDFHKIIKKYDNDYVVIQSFNLRNTLGKKSRTVKSPVSISKVPLPLELYKITIASDTTFFICLNNGWQISMRIHNAEKEIGNSLKFDCSGIGFPAEMFTAYPSF